VRERFSLDIATLDELMVLIHGPYGSGKTHLQGDFLRWAKEQGPIAYLNIKGEDGHASLASMELGMVGETVSTLEDYDAALKDYGAQKVAGLAVDSLPAFYRLVMKKVVGEVRYPEPAKDGEKAKMMWGQLTMLTMGRVIDSRAAAKYVLWVAPFDKSDDPVGGGGKAITPDLPGKLAYGCAGWFDFVGFLQAETLGPNNVQRKVTFAPSAGVLTRQRIPRPITEPITIPQGSGGWTAIFRAMQAAFTNGTPKKEAK
jgi:AAA domain